MRNAFLWVITQRVVVIYYRRFWGIYLYHLLAQEDGADKRSSGLLSSEVVTVPYRRFGTSYRAYLQGSTLKMETNLKMGPKGLTETSILNYHYSLRNNPEERSSGTKNCFHGK
jgi:hypothetical protein